MVIFHIVWHLRCDFLTSYSSRSRFSPTQPLPCLQTSGSFHLSDAGYNTGLQSFSASPVSGRRYPCWEPALQTGGVPKGELVPGHEGSVLDPQVERSFLSWTGSSQARGLKKLSCTSFRYRLNCPEIFNLFFKATMILYSKVSQPPFILINLNPKSILLKSSFSKKQKPTVPSLTESVLMR